MNNSHYVGALPIGTILSSGARSYRVVKILGQGGYGITYLATAKVKADNVWVNGQFAIKEHFDQKLNHRVGTTAAISNPSTELEIRESVKSFMVESKRLSELHHPNIVPVNESFEANNTAYYVMQYIDGGNLTEMVKSAPHGHLSEEKALSIIKQIAAAISYLHSRRMTHLDVKPDNIVMQDRNTPILIDFGLVKRYNESGKPTATNKAAGVSDGYAPLEQYAGLTEFTPEADVYALAATLLFMLTGRTPNKAGQMPDVTIRSWLTGVSNHVVNAIVHGMAVLKNLRTRSVRGFIAELETSDSSYSEHNRFVGGNFQGTKPYTTGGGTSTKKSTTKLATNTNNGKYLKIGGIAALVIFAVVAVVTLLPVNSFQNILVNNDKDVAVNMEPRADEVITVNGVSFKMIGVQGGTFQMGNNNGSDNQKPVHEVSLNTFSIGQTEVTQELWKSIMGNNPSWFRGPKRPVESVRWNDCQEFISRLNTITGRKFRLPTEAEWEFAARGGNRTLGYKYAGSNTLDEVAWYSENSGKATHEVATKLPNELVLYDMEGNVEEWCQDWYGKYNSSSQTNPTGPSSGPGRVARGGSYGLVGYCFGVSNRVYISSLIAGDYCGLRLAL
jgi:formylglycine-generating enzyme required for sulfatase activity